MLGCSAVACDARPARAWSIACLTVASSPVSAGVGVSLSRDAASLPPLPLAVFLSFLFLLSFLVSFFASFLACLLDASLGASAFLSLLFPVVAFCSLLAEALALSLAADFDLVAGVSACAIADACSPSPAIPASSNSVS